jgi:hypothetical protein
MLSKGTPLLKIHPLTCIGFGYVQVHGNGELDMLPFCAHVLAHLLLHAQCGEVLPPSLNCWGSSVVIPCSMAPARIQ